MSNGTYKLIFEGQILDGQDSGVVKKKVAALLKIDAKAADRLFTGKPVVIKKNLDKDTAAKYQNAFQKSGAVCMIESEDGMEEAPAKANNTAPIAEKPKKPPQQDAQPAAAKEPVPSPPPKPVSPLPPGSFILTNVETVPGRIIVEHFGLVSGNTIRAKHIGKDIMAGLKNLVGGELTGYTQLLQESREQAVERMTEQARGLGANAIVNVRFSTSSVAQGAAELYAYGTAVRIE